MVYYIDNDNCNYQFNSDEDYKKSNFKNLTKVNEPFLNIKDYKKQKEKELENFYDSDEMRLEVHYGATLPNRSWFKSELNKEIVAATSDFLWYLDDGSKLNVNSEQIKAVFKELVKNMKLLFYIKRQLLIDLDLLTTKEQVNKWLEAGKKALLKEKSKQKSLV